MPQLAPFARLLGRVLAVAPVALLVASALEVPLLPLHPTHALRGLLITLGALTMLAALGIGALNRRISPSGLPATRASPLPIVSTLLVVVGGVLAYASLPLALLGLLVLALDPASSVRMLLAPKR